MCPSPPLPSGTQQSPQIQPGPWETFTGGKAASPSLPLCTSASILTQDINRTQLTGLVGDLIGFMCTKHFDGTRKGLP